MAMIPGVQVTDVEAFRKWLESTDHLHDCIGHSEGQACCLDRLYQQVLFDTITSDAQPDAE